LTQSARTRKGEQTRGAILEAALALIAEQGYAGTTMRKIAARCDCSLGLAYRYFARKEDIVLAFYEQCAQQLEEEVRLLPPAKMAARLERALRADLARIAPYRGAFGALFGAALSPESELAVLGERVANVRDRVWRVFYQVVAGASDAPRDAQARDLATVFYAAHLSLVLFWLQDRSPSQRSTDALIRLGRSWLGRLRPALRLPPVSGSLARLARIIEPMFGPVRRETEAAAPQV